MTFGPRTRISRFSPTGTSATSTPGSGTPSTSLRVIGKCAVVAAGAVSVSPQEVVIRIRPPCRALSASSRSHSCWGSAAAAFDEEGFFRTGDAVALADPDDVAAGLVFRGRIAEDFKLSTGTFVSVGTLRPKLLSAAQGLLADAVVCGRDGDCVTALVWLAPAHAGRVDADGVPEPSLRADLASAMQRLAAEGGGSSQCVERLLVLTEPAQLDAGEITDKGYVNQAAVRDRRADLLARLHADPPPPAVVVR